MSDRGEQLRRYDGETRDGVTAAFEADRAALLSTGYVAVAEYWSEPGAETSDARLETTRLDRSPGVVATHLGVGGANIRAATPLARYRLEVRYAPVEAAPVSKGGMLDVVVTKNGRCPTCDLPTMQMPRPPFERYCNACETEFPA